VIELQWGGESFAVLSDKALWWPRRRTLCVADLHLGKAAAFRRGGIPVPEGTTRAVLDRLTVAIRRVRPERLVILGDLLHARDGRIAEVLRAGSAWRAEHSSLDVVLVRGNHDMRSGDPPLQWRMRVENEPFADDGDGIVAFAHHPEAAMLLDESRRVLCGHVHPAVVMSGLMRDLRAPCFWFRDRIGMLPAFGAFTGCHVVLPEARDTVFAVGDEDVIDVSVNGLAAPDQSSGRPRERAIATRENPLPRG
jgi:uncharacterized protein